MNVGKNLFWLLCMVLLQYNLYAQSNDIQRVVGPSPNVASLFKFVDQPVSLYTGTSKIEIPIYTFKTGKIELPISLMYHSGGFKVTEDASWTGLGWALNAGGAVTVSCYGLPDLPYMYNRVVKTSPTQCDLTSILQGTAETQPDLFYFCLPNQSGQFYFNDSLKVKQIPYSMIKIDTLWDPNTGEGWRITNTDGTIYLFQQTELNPTWSQVVEGTSGGNTIAPNYYSPPYTVPNVSSPSWFLTKIISPTGDSITLNYENYTAKAEYFRGETNYFQQSGIQLTCAGGPAVAVPLNNSSYDLQFINGYRLKSITSRSGSVQFITGGNRCDLLGDRYLSEIDVLDNTGKLVKKVALVYKYLVGNSLYDPSQIDCSAEVQPSASYVDVTMPSLKRRLMLTEVDEVNTVSNLIDSRYKMSYETSNGLPSKFSPQQDTWGYYNGNGQTSLLQNLSPSGQTTDGISVPTINGRTPNLTYAEQGILNKITYPTGGNTTFTYELNDYWQGPPPNQQIAAGGLRIKQAVHFDPINNSIITKNYSYTITAYGVLGSSGALASPSLSSLTNSYLTARDLACPSGTDGFPIESSIVPMLILNSNTNYPLTSTHGSTVGYSQVTETTTDQNGYDIGKTIYSFSTPADEASQNVINYVGNYLNVLPPLVNDQYPFSPNYTNEWRRGLLLKKEDYKNLGSNNYSLVKREQNFYSPPKVMDTTHGMVAGYYLNSQMTYQNNCANGAWYNSFSMFKYSLYQVFSKYVTLDSTISETFDNSGNEVKIPTYYTYNTRNLLPSIIKTVNSKNESVTTFEIYPLDYTLSGTLTNNVAIGIYNLQNKNIITPPIEVYNQKSNPDGSNSRTVSAVFNTYKSYVPLLDTIYKLDPEGAITAFSPATVTNTSVVKNSNYLPLLDFDKYDLVGNLIQQRKSNDIIHSYIWDYNKTYPIAEAVNADSASIAYTSFESDGSGNWVIPSALRDSVSVTVTGRKSYNLSNGTISKGGLTSGNSYIVSYWIKSTTPLSISGTISGYPVKGKTISGWTYFEHKITGQTSVAISGSIYIDELRLYPSNAQMTTYTYFPLIGMSSECDADNRVTYYQFDGIGRLIRILDQDQNIIKTFKYHFLGETIQ